MNYNGTSYLGVGGSVISSVILVMVVVSHAMRGPGLCLCK